MVGNTNTRPLRSGVSNRRINVALGWGDYGYFSLMPVSELVVDESKRATPFSHDKEIAKPHYYKVTLENGITTEFSPTTRSAHFRFSFPAKGEAFLVLDGYTKPVRYKSM